MFGRRSGTYVDIDDFFPKQVICIVECWILEVS